LLGICLGILSRPKSKEDKIVAFIGEKLKKPKGLTYSELVCALKDSEFKDCVAKEYDELLKILEISSSKISVSAAAATIQLRRLGIISWTPVYFVFDKVQVMHIHSFTSVLLNLSIVSNS
jgi:hypothetical protein